MALMRSAFRHGKIPFFSTKISRFRAASMFVMYQETHEMHSLATSSGSSPHVPVVPLLGPSVRRLLDSYGLDTNLIKPSGHRGQLLKGDILKYINENQTTKIDFTDILKDKLPSTQELSLGYVDINTSSTKHVMAKQMIESKMNIPHIYNTIDCNVDILSALCDKFGHSVSTNDFIIKAAALALRQEPDVNATWSNQGPVYLHSNNIAIAVDSPLGLVTPVINNADQLSVISISETISDFVEKAKSGILRPDEFQNASMTISTLGNLGVKTFTSIINPAQSAVLAVGAFQEVVSDDHKFANIMNVTLCCDGRVVDEQLASKWLRLFKDLIENPLKMGL